MPNSNDRQKVTAIAHQAIEKGDVHGWFETVYQEASEGNLVLPWDDRRPNSMLVSTLR